MVVAIVPLQAAFSSYGTDTQTVYTSPLAPEARELSDLVASPTYPNWYWSVSDVWKATDAFAACSGLSGSAKAECQQVQRARLWAFRIDPVTRNLVEARSFAISDPTWALDPYIAQNNDWEDMSLGPVRTAADGSTAAGLIIGAIGNSAANPVLDAKGKNISCHTRRLIELVEPDLDDPAAEVWSPSKIYDVKNFSGTQGISGCNAESLLYAPDAAGQPQAYIVNRSGGQVLSRGLELSTGRDPGVPRAAVGSGSPYEPSGSYVGTVADSSGAQFTAADTNGTDLALVSPASSNKPCELYRWVLDEATLATTITSVSPAKDAIACTSTESVTYARNSSNPAEATRDVYTLSDSKTSLRYWFLPWLSDETGVEGPLTTVAGPTVGSSDPTFYGNSHRLAETSGGRLLTVYGRDKTGVQLGWKDPGGKWSTATTGAVTNGTLLSGTGTGDWPASITVATDPGTGQQNALVVWGGKNFGIVRPLQLRVLTNLDQPGGPDVGSTVTLAAPSLGAARPDIGLEVGPDGLVKALVTWTERTAATSYALKAAWLDDYLAAEPQLVSTTALRVAATSTMSGTVATTPQGIRVAARAESGRMRVYGHDVSAGPADWWSSGNGPTLPSGAYPRAVGMDSGDVLVAASRDLAQGIVTVQRFTGPAQVPTLEVEMTGYAEPSIAVDGSGVRIVAVQTSDGSVVSRYGEVEGSWQPSDRVEIGAAAGGHHSWPSALDTTAGGVRFVVSGPGTTSKYSSVLAYSHP